MYLAHQYRNVLFTGLIFITHLVLTGCASNATPSAQPKAPQKTDVRDFSAVDKLAEAAHKASPTVGGLSIAIYDRNNQKVFEKNYGDFAAERRVPVASASKLVAGLVILRLVDAGKLNLDTSTTGALIGWTGEAANITLRQLLAQVGGIASSNPCLGNASITLAACVETIGKAANPLKHTSGNHFDYGGTQHQVAARMAEVATGKTWHQLFSELIAKPLSLNPSVNFYTSPWAENFSTGITNPRVAGGFYASMNDYAPLLALAFHRGQYGEQRFIRADLVDEMGRAPNPSASVGTSPMARFATPPFRYGLAAWLECATPTAFASGCNSQSSPGAFGFTPWFDRDAGYYAMIGMYQLGRATDTRVFEFSATLAQQLKPAIREAMAAR